MRAFLVLVVLAVCACGQVVIPRVVTDESVHGLTVTADLAFYTPAHDEIVTEWFVFLTPDLSASSPRTLPPTANWGGVPPPEGLPMEWLGAPASPPVGPVYAPTGVTGEVLPSPSVFGGGSWAYAAMGASFSGFMECAVWAIPPSVNPLGWNAYFVGYTASDSYGFRFWGLWSEVQ